MALSPHYVFHLLQPQRGSGFPSSQVFSFICPFIHPSNIYCGPWIKQYRHNGPCPHVACNQLGDGDIHQVSKQINTSWLWPGLFKEQGGTRENKIRVLLRQCGQERSFWGNDISSDIRRPSKRKAGKGYLGRRTSLCKGPKAGKSGICWGTRNWQMRLHWWEDVGQDQQEKNLKLPWKLSSRILGKWEDF